MADRKISDLTALTTPATGDLIPIVDISEAAAADKNKSITVGELLRGAPDGTAAAPGFAFESDGGNGMFLGGTDILAFSTGGNQAVTIDASQRVGINVTNPADTLHVRGPVSGTILNLDRAGSYSWKLGQSSGSDLTFTGDTSERVRFTSDGKVGIGSISPGSKLEVNGKTVVGSTSSDALEVFSSGDTEIGFSYNTRGNIYAKIIGDITNASPLGGEIAFQTATGGSLFERARLDSSGRLLVGTSSAPSAGGWSQYALLAVSGYRTAPTDAGALSINRGSSATNGQNIGAIAFADNTGNEYATITVAADGVTGTGDYPGRLMFSTTADGASSPTERMRISYGGQISQFSDTGWNNIRVGSATGAGTVRTFFSGFYSATAVNTGTESFRVYTNGDVQNTNNSYGAISDIKLKENIVDANSQWDDLKALQVRNYNLKEGQTHTQIGLIAQEVELVSPGLVYESPDRDADGNDLGTVTKSVNYSVLYMKAVKALQEAMERIEQLEAKVAALEAQ